MLDGGYILLHRSLLRWEWYGDQTTKTVFLHLLLTANYEDRRWRGLIIGRGQRLCSLKTLAEETKLSVRNVRTALEHLKSTGEVTSARTPQGTAITVVRYDFYQDPTRFLAGGRQPDGKPPAKDRHQWNSDQGKLNKTQELPCAFERFWQLYPKKKSKGDALKAWNVLNPDSELAAMILKKVAEATTCPDWTREGGRYIPYPATWLRAMGWEDSLGPVAQAESESEDSL